MVADYHDPRAQHDQVGDRPRADGVHQPQHQQQLEIGEAAHFDEVTDADEQPVGQGSLAHVGNEAEFEFDECGLFRWLLRLLCLECRYAFIFFLALSVRLLAAQQSGGLFADGLLEESLLDLDMLAAGLPAQELHLELMQVFFIRFAGHKVTFIHLVNVIVIKSNIRLIKSSQFSPLLPFLFQEGTDIALLHQVVS